MLSQHPGTITNILIAINGIMFVITLLVPNVAQLALQDNSLVLQGQYWRLFTAMFLHGSIMHIFLNMLSLFFIGRIVEALYGPVRYLTIYFLSGIAGGLLYLLTSPAGLPLVGASGAIFGVFGALGVFYIINRRALGAYGRGAIANWFFWIGLNLIFGFTVGSGFIAMAAHIGGLIAGMILGWVLMPRMGNRRI